MRLALALSLALQASYPFMMPAFAVDENAVITLNNEGVKALNAGNYADAIKAFEAALGKDPTYKLARENLAIAHNNYGLQLRNNPPAALQQFHKALYLNPSNATTLQNVEGIIRMMGKDPKNFNDRVKLGEDSQKSGDFISAIIEYQAALNLKPDPKIYVKLGDVYRVRGEDDKAIAEYQMAAKAGDSAEIELKLGQAYGAKKDVANAIAAYGRAISYKSDDPDVLDGLVTGWNEALKENPTAPENHIGLGQAYQYKGDFGQAKAEYEQALRFSAGHRNPVAERLLQALPAAQQQAEVTRHINNGVDLQARKLYDPAIQEYQAALKLDPNNDSTWVNIGTAYQAEEKFAEALRAYNQALKLNPGNQAAQQGVKTATAQSEDKMVGDAWKAGGDLFKQGNYQAAADKYLQVLKVTPNDPATHFSLGAVYQAMKNYDQAMAEYRTAISLDPKNAQYKAALEDCTAKKVQPIIDAAVAKHKDKDYTGAIDLYQQALAITPKNSDLWYDIASAEYSRQNYQSSQQAYQKAYDTEPKKQVACLYFIAVIMENYGKGLDAKQEYMKYMSQAPGGTYFSQAKERVEALTKDITATEKIKSEEQLANDKKADDAYNQAVKLQQSGQFDQAIALYNQGIQIQPKNDGFYYAKATAEQQKKDYNNAIADYNQAINLAPKNKDYQNALTTCEEEAGGPIADQAVQKQQAGDIAGAVELYNQALKFMPNNGGVYTNLGTALQQSDNFKQAHDAYEKGYSLDNKQVGNLFFMAKCSETIGAGAQALSEYQRYVKAAGAKGQYSADAQKRILALGTNPNNVEKLQTSSELKTAATAGASYDEGIKLQTAGKLDDAIAKYNDAITAQPTNADFEYALGTAYQQKGDWDSAVTHYQKAVSLAPGNTTFKKTLADAQTSAGTSKAGPLMDQAVAKQTSGDIQGAITLYEQGLQAAPNFARGWTNLGSAYQQAENFSKAKECYQKAYSIDPKGEVDNLYYLGVLEENDGKGLPALQDYQKYISSAPRGQNAAAAQARISALKANITATQKITTQAQATQNTEAQTAYADGIKAQQDNKLDDAIADYKKAIGISPKDGSFHYALGTAYQGKNDIDAAIDEYKQAVALAPTVGDYKNTLRAAYGVKAAPLVNAAIEKQTTKNDPKGAIVDYLAALKVNSDDGGTHMNLGTAYQQTNQLMDAEREYRRALQLDPKGAVDAWYYLGTLMEQMKKPGEALQMYMRYVKDAPGGANVKDANERIKLLRPHR
jgi:tetratricopeptide (TPR) repeat protein